ncbi:MAG: hypothetical protein M1823_004955 [Watsoniomyces obsoletus]|nr:MAG: hypothetical protein M1823_004955 [Watsoniomyces obsoletus]
MAEAGLDDGSEDVNDFLRRIRELDEKRNREDEERTRKLEEEILKGRQERQVRRAERARSISPTKDSPSETPMLLRFGSSQTVTPETKNLTSDAPPVLRASQSSSPLPPLMTSQTSSPRQLSEPPSVLDIDNAPKLSPRPRQDSVEATRRSSPPRSSPSAAIAPSKMSPLAWQRRPDPGQLGTRNSRPSSVTAPESPAASNAVSRPQSSSTNDDSLLSRADISRTLQSKDPSWFRQTEDRGSTSPALRRDHEEASTDETASWARTRLPGMSGSIRGQAPSSQNMAPSESMRSTSPVRVSPLRDSAELPSTYSTNTSASDAMGLRGKSVSEMGAPRPEASSAAFLTRRNSQRETSEFGRSLAMSPAQGRIVPDRPVSPTKGLGGFVQSAMLKRNDSVQKRWSVQSPQRHGRDHSLTSRSEVETMSNILTATAPSNEAGSSIRRTRTNSIESSQASESRPHSRRGNSEPQANGKLSSAAKPAPMTPQPERIETTTPSETARPTSSTAGSQGDETPRARPRPQSIMSPPMSPTKTADPKRWSPSKASWLESALNKGPENYKVKPPASEQPSWMAGVPKWKQQDVRTPGARERNFQEVKTGGLMRAPPPGPLPKPVGSSASLPKTSTPTERVPSKSESISSQGHVFKGVSSPKMPSAAGSPNVSQSEVEGFEDSGMTETSSEVLDHSTTQTSTASAADPPRRGSELEADAKSSGPATKSKPPTPPKKDFRSVLKPRQLPDNSKRTEEPEFKNVFGKLKHTTTQKYVAPDELKGNILRGKAALSSTGGPQKTERTDELKESLLKQKEAMKAKSASEKPEVPSKPSTPELGAREEQPAAPAMIAKQKLTSRSTGNLSMKSNAELETPEAIAKQKALKESRSLEPPPRRTQSASADQGSSSSGSQPGTFNSRLAGLLSRGPPAVGSKGQEGKNPPSTSLERPSPTGSTSPHTASEIGSLTHLTKGRARGPKRRLPQVKEETQPSEQQLPTTTGKDLSRESDAAGLGLTGVTTARLGPRPLPTLDAPRSAGKTTGLPLASEQRQTPKATPIELGSGGSEAANRQSALGRFPVANGSIRGARPLPSTARPEATQSKTSGQRWLDGDQAKEAVEKPSPSTPASDIQARSNAAITAPIQAPAQNRPLPSPPAKPAALSPSPRSRSVSKAESNNASVDPLARKDPRSTSSHTDIARATEFFKKFFDNPSAQTIGLQLDIPRILAAGVEEPEKIKTLRKRIWQVTGDGKEEPIPAHQEHILFQDNMYICTHHYQAANGTSQAEVYFWAGNNVSEAAVEDAQLFARRAAKSCSGRLIKIRQGYETPAFFQALGGIIVTRRGSSSRRDSTMAFILCGRRHLGHIAFDEVDFSLGSLCSGYPYIICSPPRRIWLWKGKGSGADELGCARLIGMDCGVPGGELEEVEEGKETKALLNILKSDAASTVPKCGEFWALKPKCDAYRVRLYRIAHEGDTQVRPRFWPNWQQIITHGLSFSRLPQVTEISPFSQADLRPSHIYCLDAFFEIYIIIGAQARSRFIDLQAALGFAKEYAALAATQRDRPAAPTISVVLSGVPLDMKAAFRHWDDDQRSTTSNSGQLSGAASSLHQIPVEVAFEAISLLGSSRYW